MSKEEIRKPANKKRRDKKCLWGCPGSALMACRFKDLVAETDMITVHKAEVLLQI